jgi:hypothetical protein
MARMRAIVFVSVVGVVGCKSHHDAPPPAHTTTAPPVPSAPPTPKPLAITWSDDSIEESFTVVGGGGAGRASADPRGVDILFAQLLPGSTWSIGGKQGSAATSLVTVEGLDFLGPVAFDSITRVDPNLTLHLSLPDGRTGDSKVPPIHFKHAVRDIFSHVEHAPVTFGKEPADPKPSDSIFYLGGGITGEIIGTSGTLQQIDFVAMQERQDASGTKLCSGYTGPHPSITINLKATDVALWNRRTGSLVEKKTFPPDDTCPIVALTTDDSGAIDSLPPTPKIEAWLKTKLKR